MIGNKQHIDKIANIESYHVETTKDSLKLNDHAKIVEFLFCNGRCQQAMTAKTCIFINRLI